MGRSVHISAAQGMYGSLGTGVVTKIFGGGVGGDEGSAAIAAGRSTTVEHAVEAAAGRVRAHIADAIGEERVEPETAAGATNESGDEMLGEKAIESN